MKVQFISPVLAFMALAVNATPSWSNPHISQSTPEENLSDFIQEEEKIKHTQATPPEPSNFESTYNTAVIFQCDNSHTIPITKARISDPSSEEEYHVLYWVPHHFPTHQALELCENVANQLQSYYNSGELKELSLVAGWVEQRGAVCIESTPEEEGVGQYGDGNCTPNQDKVLFYLNDNDKPNDVLLEMIPKRRGGIFTRVSFPWLP